MHVMSHDVMLVTEIKLTGITIIPYSDSIKGFEGALLFVNGLQK